MWAQGDVDPYKGLQLDLGDGKIQVNDYDDKATKFRYFVKRRSEAMGEFKKYFKEFDWKQKGLVRKRFETIRWAPLIKTGTSLTEFKNCLSDCRDALKTLESITGKIPALKSLYMEQHMKYNFLSKPRSYYKDFFLA